MPFPRLAAHHRWAAILIASVNFLTPVRAADVTTQVGVKIVGDITGSDATTAIIANDGKSQRLPWADVALIEFPSSDKPPAPPYIGVELIDGSQLHCKAFTIQDTIAELQLLAGGSVKAPLSSVFTILRDAHDPKVQKDWADVLAKRGRLDLVAVRSDGKLDGLEGTLGNGTPAGDRIEFTLAADEKKRTPQLANLAGLAFATKADVNLPIPLGRLLTSGRDRLLAAKIDLENDNRWVVTTLAGAKATLASDQIMSLDCRKAKFAYLSDLNGEKELSSTEGFVFEPAKDRSLQHTPLRLAGTPYEKGLSVHSRTSLVYELNGEYREFRAVLGVDDSVSWTSRVQVLIEGDGRELLRTTIASKAVPKPIALDVKGVSKLRITVSAAVLDLNHQVNLADARLSK